jgi:hypothetical protein
MARTKEKGEGMTHWAESLGELPRHLWTDEVTGLECFVVRNSMGVYLGYVRVPEDHPWFERDDDETRVDVHGGLTWSGPLKHRQVDKRRLDGWWLGFDCAHYGNGVPGIPGLDGTYRDFTYVVKEVESLAGQIFGWEAEL